MKYFFSSPAPLKQALFDQGAQNFLLSFAVDAKEIGNFEDPEFSLIIDSGAFSAWNSGKTIDIDEYLKFCLEHDQKNSYISLDVIPETGSTRKEKELCAEQGFENYLYMKDRVKNTMPVFHYGDDFKWLKKFMEQADYIGISPANDTHENVKVAWLKEVFSILKTDYKTHALGYTTLKGMVTFPFYSVDSISYKRAKCIINGKVSNFLYAKKIEFMIKQNINNFLHLEDQVTKMWTKRGVIWN